MSQEVLLQRVDAADLGTVQDWVDAATPQLRNRLVKRCGLEVPVLVESAEGRRLEEVLQRDSVAACPFSAEPSGLRGLILLEASLVRAAVGRFLGDASDVPQADRPLSQLDLRFAARLCQDLLEALIGATPMDVPPNLHLGRISPNTRAVTALPQARHVVDVPCQLGVDSAPLGKLWVVLPPQGAGVLWPKRGPVRNVRRHPAAGMGRVMPLPVPVVAELARAKMPLSRLRGLQVGDVVDLGHLGDVTVRVGDKPSLFAEPGEADGMRSVRVRRRVRDR